MSFSLGGIAYDLSVDTAGLIRGEREGRAALDRLGQAGDALHAKLTSLASAVKVLAVAMAMVKGAELADDMRLLQARVNVATDSIEAGARAMESLRDISQRTHTALDGNVQVFTRLNASLKQMGGTEADTLRITELLAKAITVSGATAAEKTAAMLQFGQALGSGKLAGDELRSLLETAPYLMKQLAAGLGVPIGALKSLGEQGKLTADVVVNALGKAADRITKDFEQFPETLSGAMTVAGDSARRVNQALDELGGKSAMLTGIAKGTGQALDALADYLLRVAAESDKVGRSDIIKTWAANTANALSYVVDAADFVSRGFLQMGHTIGGAAAAAGAAARGEFKQAREILSLLGDDLQRIGAKPYAGAAIRQMMAEKAAMPAPVAPPPSKLKAPVDADEARKLAAKRAAAQAYYDGLLADAATGLAKIALEEEKALQENKRRAMEDKANADIYAKAKVAIVEKYARERALLEEQYAKETAAFRIAITEDESARIIMIREETIRAAVRDEELGVKTAQQAAQAIYLAHYTAEMQLRDVADRNARARADQAMAETRDTERRIELVKEETIRALELAKARGKITDAELAAGKARAERQAQDDRRALTGERANFTLDTLGMKAQATGGTEDNIAYAKAQANMARQAAKEALDAGIADRQQYAERVKAIEEQLEAQLYAIRMREVASLSTLGDAFGQLTQALYREGGKQDAIYRASFIAQKAFAIASAIVNIQAGVARAANTPWPTNLVAMASVIASTASIIATIRSTSYGGGRQYGGPVAEGTMYRVNETGRPEMYTAANGAQYMLPTRDGKVTSADKAVPGGNDGGPRVINFTQHNHFSGPPASLQTQQQLTAAAMRGLRAVDGRGTA